jgi:hypothetical protein
LRRPCRVFAAEDGRKEGEVGRLLPSSPSSSPTGRFDPPASTLLP